jgi:hypothetical protein
MPSLLTYALPHFLFSSVRLDDMLAEPPKFSTEISLLLKRECHSDVCFVHLVALRKTFFILMGVRRYFSGLKLKDSDFIFLKFCRFTELQRSGKALSTNTIKCQLHKNTTFCYSDNHQNNSQSSNAALPGHAQLAVSGSISNRPVQTLQSRSSYEYICSVKSVSYCP